MAEVVQIPGAGTTAKIRSPVAVAILAFITITIYVWFWWYFINREMRDLGRARGTDELGTSPGRSVLAITLGALVIVPAIWSIVTTFKRVQATQRLSGKEPINGWIGLILLVVISPAFYGYTQSGLSGAWRAQSPVT
jgi:hypothetical protein